MFRYVFWVAFLRACCISLIFVVKENFCLKHEHNFPELLVLGCFSTHVKSSLNVGDNAVEPARVLSSRISNLWYPLLARCNGYSRIIHRLM